MRHDWWRFVPNDATDMHLPGIYEWRIEDQKIYIGQSKHLVSRIHEYPNNVRKILAGEPYRRGNPKGFRRVHDALRLAHDQHCRVTVAILENCPLSDLNEKKRAWIVLRREQGIEVLNDT